MSDATCIIRNRSNEDMATRREYGCFMRKGVEHHNPQTGKMEHNTVYYDWNSFADMPMENQIQFYKDNLANLPKSKMIKFLQDRFYRMYKGYPVVYYKLPLDNPEKLELYNQTALDCGHPECMVDSNGNPLKMCNQMAEKIVKSKDAVLGIECAVEAGAIDVIDANGNVIAENVSTPKAEASPKNASKIKRDVVVFGPGAKNTKHHEKDAPERIDEYVAHNKAVMDASKYPDYIKAALWQFIQMCAAEGRVVRLDNMKGLVLATIYTKNVPEAIDCTKIKRAIDPGKIRNGCFILTEDPDMILSNKINLFKVVGIQVGDPCLRNYLFEPALMSDADSNRVYQEHIAGAAFYRYISYNAFRNDELVRAANITYALCDRMMQLNLNVRFKVLEKKSINEFDLVVTDNVGLGYYVTGNKEYMGLVIHAQCNNGFAYYTASGKSAKKFASLINTPLSHIVYVEPFTKEQAQSLGEAIDKTIDAVEKVNHDAEVKQNAKKINPKKGKKQTAEIPAGRK